MLARRGRVALLAKTKANLSRDHYEVIIVQERKAHVWPNGIESEAHEAMPCSEDWGKYGWTPFDEQRAWEMFKAKCREWPESGCTRPKDAFESPEGVRTADKTSGEFLSGAEKNAGGQPMQKRNSTGNSEEPVEIPTLGALGI